MATRSRGRWVFRREKRWAVALWLAAFLAAAAGACGPPRGQRGEGPGGRDQPLGLSPREELALGRKAYEEVLSKYRVEPRDSPAVRRVRQVGARIAKASEIEPLRREIHLR